MKLSATYVRDGDWWIGYVDEVPGANAQGRTVEEARDSLREAVELIVTTNRELARRTVAEGDGAAPRDVLHEELLVAV